MTWLYIPSTALPCAPESAASSSGCELHLETGTAACASWRGKRMLPRHWRAAWKKAAWILPGFEPDISEASASAYAEWVTRSVRRSFSVRRRLERAIAGKGSSCWPTPAAGDADRASDTYCRGEGNPTLLGSARTWAADQWASPGSMGGGSVSRGGDRVGEPLLAGQAELWATPAGRDGRDGRASEATMERNSRPLNEQVEMRWATASDGNKPSAGKRATSDLSHQAQATEQPGSESSPSGPGSRRRLNPMFVCWLMGFPHGWAHPELTSSWRTAMQSYLCRQRQLLASLLVRL